jgi:hypothetical protein
MPTQPSRRSLVARISVAVRVSVIAPVSCAAALALVGAPPAAAAPIDSFTRAVNATYQAASLDGLDVIVLSTSNRSRDLPGRRGALPARAKIRQHFEIGPAGDEYTSVRLAKGNRLLGSWGYNAAQGMWSTLSGIYGAWPAVFASSRGISLTRAITGLDARMTIYPDNRRALSRSLGALLPPTYSEAEDYWQEVVETPGPGGSTVITATSRGNAEAEDECRYSPIRIVIQGGRIASTSWKATCPDGRVTTHQGTVGYDSDIGRPTEPTISQSAAFALPTRPNLATWRQLANAANLTAATPFASVGLVIDLGRNDPNVPTSEGLQYLDLLMRWGNAGEPRAVVDATGATTYTVTPAPGRAVVVDDGVIALTSLTVVVGPDGVIRSIRAADPGPPPMIQTTTFNR